jgi:hypothetical protein
LGLSKDDLADLFGGRSFRGIWALRPANLMFLRVGACVESINELEYL